MVAPSASGAQVAGKIDSILIVGGGTAGWLAATYLANRLGTYRPDGVKITLIESADIGAIGVGEATFPTMRLTMATIGIDEARFMRESSGTFKQAIKFYDWTKPPQDGKHSHYYHPFNPPHVMGNSVDLMPYWVMGGAGDVPFSEAVSIQDAVCDAGKGPKRIDDPQYAGRMNYAYHIDAAKFANMLRGVGRQLGVTHLIGTVEKVNVDETGAIASVISKEHGELKADLYVDCTGFASLLIGKALNEPFHDMNDCLFDNAAIAMQFPYEKPDDPIATATIAAAQEAGWIWDIGLHERRGTGYVYCDRYTDADRAEQVLREYLGPRSKNLEAKRIKIRIGYRERHWVKNCVAVGLAGGFLEPLESTGILLIEAAVHMLADSFPRTGVTEPVAKFFNAAMKERYERAVDFIKMHFYLNKRLDTPFWHDNADPKTCKTSLLDKLEMWKLTPPTRMHCNTFHDSFQFHSYQYVMLGLGTKPDLSAHMAAYPYAEQAKAEFARVRETAKHALTTLPGHRELVDDIYKHGFQPPPQAAR